MLLASEAAVPGEAIRFAGYPGGPHDGRQLFAARGRITAIGDGLATYDIETFKSNSGGPVWRERDGRAELLAIHVKPSGGRIVDADYQSEVARLITRLDDAAGAPAAE
jgi:V8-like Glu-specific endopeptidase